MSQTIHNETNPKGGPRTAAGKAASSKNSFKHGLASGQILIEGEDPDAFDALVADLEADYQPATETEALLVHDLAKFHWLADRAIRLQALAFASAAFASAIPEIPASLNVLIRYQTTNQRAFQTTLKSLQAIQKEREKAERASSPPSEQTEARSKTQRTSSPPSEQTEARSKTQRTEEFVSQEPVQAPEEDEDFTSGPPEGWFNGTEFLARYSAELQAQEEEERKQADIRYRAKLEAERMSEPGA
jgi:hypothetical protein